MTHTPSNVLAGTTTLEVLEEIRRHAVETYPDECCGALIASDGRIVEAYRLPNTTAAAARRRFQISPSDYRRSEQRATEQQGALAGFYHSHPDHPARPSRHDLEQAWPNLTYVIVAVRAGDAGEITSWRLRDDRSGFDQGDL
jgi:proteasome lid subunit RPN8/RPN11